MAAVSPLKVQPKRTSNDVLSPRHDSKKPRAILRPPLPISFQSSASASEAADMDIDDLVVPSSRMIALSRGLGSSSPMPQPATPARLTSGRMLVDLSGLSFPENTCMSFPSSFHAFSNFVFSR